MAFSPMTSRVTITALPARAEALAGREERPSERSGGRGGRGGRAASPVTVFVLLVCRCRREAPAGPARCPARASATRRSGFMWVLRYRSAAAAVGLCSSLWGFMRVEGAKNSAWWEITCH